MFCSKCGSKLADHAAFCQNCGTKVAQPIAAPAGRPAVNTGTAAVPAGQAVVSAPGYYRVPAADPFQTFVDEHVRKTTAFPSAKALLDSPVSLVKEWLIAVVPSVLIAIICFVNLCNDASYSDAPAVGLLLLAVGVGLFVFAIVFNAVYFALWVKRTKCTARFSGYFDEEIDVKKLREFLNQKLGYLAPYFHEWGILAQTGYTVRSAVQVSLENSMSQSMQETRLCTEFGTKTNLTVILYVRPDIQDRESGRKEYFVDVKQSASMGIPQLSTYTCVYKSAPILQAAMEYFVHHSETK